MARRAMDAGKGQPGAGRKAATAGPAPAIPEVSGREHRLLMRSALGDVTVPHGRARLVDRRRARRGGWWHIYLLPTGRRAQTGPHYY